MPAAYVEQGYADRGYVDRGYVDGGTLTTDPGGGDVDLTEVLAKLDEIIATLAITDLWVKRIAVTTTGISSGAGSGTEVFNVSALGITATATLTNGNRTNVVWS